jgi:hypothetical protein
MFRSCHQVDLRLGGRAVQYMSAVMKNDKKREIFLQRRVRKDDENECERDMME